MTNDAALPTTMVSHTEPYTLVRISRPQYSPSLLTHELTHVLAMCGSTWLSEGLAVWMQRTVAPGPCFPDDSVEQGFPPERPLAEWLFPTSEKPGDGGRDALLSAAAYREAAAFVQWMMSSFGLSVFKRFFVACRRSRGTEALVGPCSQIGFRSVHHMEDEWRKNGHPSGSHKP